MKKFLCLLLAALMCITLLAACTPTPDEPGDEENDNPLSDLPPEEQLVLFGSGVETVQVIRSELLNAQAVETQGAVKIVSAIESMTGTEPLIGTDYSGPYGTPETECEILVGKTERPESAQAMEKLGDKDYVICVIGKKVCIVAENDRGMEAGVDKFINSYLCFKENKLYTSNKLEVQGMFEIAENVYFKVPGPAGSGADKYDESVAMACVQGIMNRESTHKVYINNNSETADWLKVLSEEGRWLSDVTWLELTGFEELLKFSKDYIKSVIIWDPDVPATVNVACTIAGVEDGVVMTEKMYDTYKDILNSNIKVTSLVDMFDGTETGSAKNDAYRWAIRNYLETGLCSTDYICSYIDSWSFRNTGNISYTVVRDWGVYHRAFVYDLSPWPDEKPLDDPEQELGTDHETLMMIFEIMLEQTRDLGPYEVCGFFEHQKYSESGDNTESTHGSVGTEWEYAKLMTPYNGYHNTCIDNAYNESFHGLYDGVEQLENNRPDETMELQEDVVYLCFFMGDYDSTHPVYRYLKQAWDDPRRGEMPFAWAINPNLIETYPDLIEYYYETATDNDYFVSDASAAGYFMPNKVPDELWPNLLEHNLKYFKLADMSIAPMVLDTDHMSPTALEWMSQIAPDGLGTVNQKKNYMYGDTVVTALLGKGYDRYDSAVGAENLAKVIEEQFNNSNSGASLCMLRCVWTTPTVMCETVELYRAANPDKEVKVVDIYTYFDLMKQDLNWK